MTTMNSFMRQSTRIYVAGHQGLVGSALMRCLWKKGYEHLIIRTHAELDLTDTAGVHAFFTLEKPEVVFLAAAKVGGIQANNAYPAEFIRQNLAIQTNVIHEAWRHNVKRLLFLGSSCIYPRDCMQPIKEEYLLTGPLEPTNRPYAIAKIAGIEMCWAYNRQYGTKYLPVMPTNLYGLNDNYDLNNSHVLPALIRKFYEEKYRGDKQVIVLGSGTPRREFLYSDDLADACVFLINQDETIFNNLLDRQLPTINIGVGKDLTIMELAEIVNSVVGFQGKIAWDSTKPDGTPRKILDVSMLASLGWRYNVDLYTGIHHALLDYQSRL